LITFHEVVVVLFLTGPGQPTLSLQMWTNLRFSIDPTILTVATLIFGLAVIMLLTLEMVRRRSEKLRGVVV
jgi:putative spermidine/putrescine transport system permease protein